MQHISTAKDYTGIMSERKFRLNHIKPGLEEVYKLHEYYETPTSRKKILKIYSHKSIFCFYDFCHKSSLLRQVIVIN
jgi:hypothetical protein